MKKNLVLRISFVLILAIIFSVFSINAAAIAVRDNPVPLAGDFTFEDDDEAAAEDMPVVNPKTGDNALLFILTLISLTGAGTAVCVSKKSRVK